MEDKEVNFDVPYTVFKDYVHLQDKKIKRLIWIIVLFIICLVVTNLAWLKAWLSYDYIGYQALSQDGGNASVIGNDGDIYNGISNSPETDQEESEGR